MEISEFSTKSLLKKTSSFDINKVKRVTFSNTVKVFVDDPNKVIDTDENLEVRYIEINIVDKSKETLDGETSLDDCKVTDFLVHKVIYDNYILPDDDELGVSNEISDDGSILFESGVEDDDLEFVVHKVTDHEDDLIEKDSDFNADKEEQSVNVSTSDPDDVKLVTKFSELSIENILEHDKIIALIDQTSLGLSALNKTSVAVSSCEDTSNKKYEKSNDQSLDNKSKAMIDNLVLSPPLQELSLEKIVKAHSDNILCELDISPLNSIQETDSESDASSEGTMIMMTSEECQKNEQHIRESFLQYQSLKERSSKSKDLHLADSCSNNSVCAEECNSEINHNDSKLTAEVTDCKSAVDNVATDMSGADFNEAQLLIDSVSTEKSSSISLPCELKLPKRTCSSSLPDTELLYTNYNNLHSKYKHALKRASLENSTNLSRKPIRNVEIPSDVREWKILLSSFEKDSRDVGGNANQSMHCKEGVDSKVDVGFPSFSDDSDGAEAATSVPKSDELENFVHESTERVERIRKRYHVNGKLHARFGVSRHAPVRGIRPRFGSTAEILQLMQKQNNPPFITFSGTKNHMSWPCEETSSNHELQRNVMDQHSNSFYVSQSLTSEYSSQSSIDSYSEEPLNTSCDHCSISSCPSIIVHERGVPEGASPPRPRMEINIDSSCPNYDSDSFVYYSLKV